MYYSKGLGLMGEPEFVVLNTVNLLLHCKGFLQEIAEECKPLAWTRVLSVLVMLCETVIQKKKLK